MWILKTELFKNSEIIIFLNEVNPEEDTLLHERKIPQWAVSQDIQPRDLRPLVMTNKSFPGC